MPTTSGYLPRVLPRWAPLQYQHVTKAAARSAVEADFCDAKCELTTLKTAHAAKGDTYRHCYIIAPNLFPMESNMLSTDVDIRTEEINIYYVAMTRSSWQLTYLRDIEQGQTMADVYLQTN